MLLNFNDKEVDDANIMNMINFWKAMKNTSPPCECIEQSKMTLIHCPVKNSQLNFVFETQLTEMEVDNKIQEVKAYFTKRNVPFRWYVTPDTTPFNLPIHLEKAGFQRRMVGAMAVEIEKLKIPPNPKGFRYELIDNSKLELYCKVLTKGFEFDHDAEEFFPTLLSNKYLINDFHYYLGYLEEEPVATSAIYYSAGVAGLYNVGTIPEFRGRGIGSAMSSLPLLDAFQKGYRISILQFSQMGRPIYEKLGYMDRGSFYYWFFDPTQTT